MIVINSTFDKDIAKYEHILVMFYGPWCAQFKKLKPEIEKASATLSKENLKVTKINDTAEKLYLKIYS